jgi:hypothetical protein
MKSYEEINAKIESKKAVVLTAEEIIGYVEKKGLATAAREVDVVTIDIFGPMCSSSCFLNFGHSKPRIRMTQAWIDAGREAGAARAVLRLRRVSPAGAPHHLRHQRPQSGHRGVQSKTIRSAAGRSIRCPTLTNTGFTPLRVRSTVPMISPRSRRDELDPRLMSGSTKVPQSRRFAQPIAGIAAHEPHVAS